MVHQQVAKSQQTPSLETTQVEQVSLEQRQQIKLQIVVVSLVILSLIIQQPPPVDLARHNLSLLLVEVYLVKHRKALLELLLAVTCLPKPLKPLPIYLGLLQTKMKIKNPLVHFLVRIKLNRLLEETKIPQHLQVDHFSEVIHKQLELGLQEVDYLHNQKNLLTRL